MNEVNAFDYVIDFSSFLTVFGGYVPRHSRSRKETQVDHENCFSETETGFGMMTVANVEAEMYFSPLYFP